MTRIFHWFFMGKMDPMSGCDIRLVFTLPPRDSTLQYKRCVHLWNNFPCIITLVSLISGLRNWSDKCFTTPEYPFESDMRLFDKKTLKRPLEITRTVPLIKRVSNLISVFFKNDFILYKVFFANFLLQAFV